MSCPHCGAATSAGARFCPTCGHTLEAVTVGGTEDATFAPGGLSPSGHRPSSSGGWLTSSDAISHGRFAPGSILDGRYRIIGLLGRGGMGEVYRADDLRLGQPVALKFLPDAVAADPVRLAQFHNEVRTARQVSHPNICRVYDIGELDGHLFLSMEFVDGEDLSTSLRRIGRFPEDKATDIARQLCAGLAAAHERGVLHRDLKPANVMLDEAGKVRVMDFGLAAIGKVEDIRAGTPAYMAPEQLLGREVTARSDIYSLGLVLYELFTGRRAFPATTLNDLVEQHQSGQLTPPGAILTNLDPAIDRAILRCLDRDPARRPSSALAVSAALPGGDPLAAALAAGETPSPAMVAAAGEGAGLSQRVAVPLFAAVLIGIAAVYAMVLRTDPLERLRPEFSADVLAQKARDAIRQLGYTERPQDEGYNFTWDTDLVAHMRSTQARPAIWTDALLQRPSPLGFRYRSSQSPMVASEFHHDLLTPGILTMDDPAPIESGMIALALDHQGRLTGFEAVPPQVEEPFDSLSLAQDKPTDSFPLAQGKPVDWTTLLALAGLDAAGLQTATPQWNWLAASDTRVAWTGTWPGTSYPLRVEAAAHRGRPVAFLVIGPWTKPWRTASGESSGQETAFAILISLLALSILIGGGVLARRNLRQGRGDRAGAFTLGASVAIALWMLWICQVHVSASFGMMGPFFLAVCSTTFYGVLFWAIYLALEPFVRRHWPQTLVSWTTVVGGRVRDPIVGRDVLVGVAFGVSTALLIGSTALLGFSDAGWPAAEYLLGMRAGVGRVLMHALYALRSALFVFFLLFVLRVLLRNQWAAAVAFVALFALLNALASQRPLVEGTITLIYFSLMAVVVLRWGLVSLAIGVLVADLLLNVPATSDFSAWYFGQTILLTAIVVALAAWGYYTSVSGRMWKADAFA